MLESLTHTSSAINYYFDSSFLIKSIERLRKILICLICFTCQTVAKPEPRQSQARKAKEPISKKAPNPQPSASLAGNKRTRAASEAQKTKKEDEIKEAEIEKPEPISATPEVPEAPAPATKPELEENGCKDIEVGETLPLIAPPVPEPAEPETIVDETPAQDQKIEPE